MIKIGIPLRYDHLENGRGITFLSEKLRKLSICNINEKLLITHEFGG